MKTTPSENVNQVLDNYFSLCLSSCSDTSDDESQVSPAHTDGDATPTCDNETSRREAVCGTGGNLGGMTDLKRSGVGEVRESVSVPTRTHSAGGIGVTKCEGGNVLIADTAVVGDTKKPLPFPRSVQPSWKATPIREVRIIMAERGIPCMKVHRTCCDISYHLIKNLQT